MDPNREPFDPTLDALLRTHSNETPSPDVDAAILAAAHRAVQSAPRIAKPAEATSPWRWWMPLAAAATIGAVAIGVLQLLPKEPESTATVVTDTPPAAQSVAPQRIAPETPAPAPSIAQKPTVPPPPPAGTREKREARSDAQNEAKRAARPEPFVAQERDTAAPTAAPPTPAPPMPTRNEASGAVAVPEPPRAAAPAVAKQRAAVAAADSLSADEWIARIRSRLNENKHDDAARELNAFRAAYADADERMPPDLKAWAATVKR